nr:lipase 3-like isoform X1 [Leptinotarsa decemlineata]
MYGNVLIFMLLISLRGVPGKENEKDLQIITKLITSNGYPVETHEVETEDGYFLTVHRIPRGKNQLNGSTGTPVLFSHGMGGSAENFIWMGPEKSLGYKLADCGFDVWLLNARGSWHSLKHKTLDPDRDTDFWKFSWHEIAVFDIPATIDYILDKTNRKSLHYIGLSQGTTTLFAMGSERVRYNDKIKVMIALGPAAVIIKPKHPLIRLLLPFYEYFQLLAKILRVYKLPPLISMSTSHKIFYGICGHKFSPVFVCKYVMFILGGIEHNQFDTKVVPLVALTAPAGMSTNQMVHYAQNIKRGRFEQFDFGKKENLKKYGLEKPPSYNITRATFPVALVYVENDLFVSKETLEILVTSLPNIVDVYKVPNKEWTHIDLVWGKDMDILLNPRVIDVLKKYD